jgi:uncharacterized membrane protein
MSISKDLSELVSANIISEESAQKISDFYIRKSTASPNRQLLIFGIVGALLIGVGLMFIIANQWDELSQSLKTACAFLLLIIPQALAAFVILKKEDKIAWRESTALLLFFAVGANISLVSQIYHINGDASSYFLTWMVLTVPLIYILDSSAMSLAWFIGVMSYGFAVKSDVPDPLGEYLYWILFALPVPRYIRLFKKSPDSVLFSLHHWVIPFVLSMAMIIISHRHEMLMSPVYVSMFGLVYLTGNCNFFRGRPILLNGYRIIGLAGTIITLLAMSFKSMWENVSGHHYILGDLIIAPEFIGNVVFFVLASLLLYRQIKTKSLSDWKLMDVTYLVFLVFFIPGTYTSQAYILVNLYLIVLAFLAIREGTKLSHLGVLNSGMIVIALLAVCRSFDTDLTFAVKGSMFVLVGIGFFAANWLMLKKRKQNES